VSHYGKYRGEVKQNIDPMQMGRVQVEVPAVLGEGRLSWAMPCAPFSGSGVGFFAVPPVNASVWVEFEGGDTDWPIYSGGFWAMGQVPASPAIEQMTVLARSGVTITLNSTPGVGGLTIEVGPPATAVPMKLALGPDGIELSTGASSVKLTPVSVSLNDDALQVM
jgi:hypothetical protein